MVSLYFIYLLCFCSDFQSNICLGFTSIIGLPHGSDSKESTCNAGDLGLIPCSGRSPGVGNGNPFQYSCLENSMEFSMESMGSQSQDMTK